MHVRRVIVLLVYLLSLFFSVAIAKEYTSDKRVQGPSTFKTMMRYGRAVKDGKLVSVYPRADTFFLGPRYGKRSSNWNPNSSVIYPASSTIFGDSDGDLSCSYTGLSNLYRCSLRKNRSTPNLD